MSSKATLRHLAKSQWVKGHLAKMSVGHNVRASYVAINEGKSVTSFCCQVAAWFPDMFWNFYSVKTHNIAKNSTTTKARQKIITYLEFLKF